MTPENVPRCVRHSQGEPDGAGTSGQHQLPFTTQAPEGAFCAAAIVAVPAMMQARRRAAVRACKRMISMADLNKFNLNSSTLGYVSG